MPGGTALSSKRNLPRAYFDLQLRFAEAMAVAEDTPLAESVTRNTDFHRRFGLGRRRGESPSPGWVSYLQGLAGMATHERRVAWTWEFFLGSPAEAQPVGLVRFGCFYCDPPDATGMLRIHFADQDRGDEIGPLSRARMGDRVRELTQLFGHVGAQAPGVRFVRGGSWLYNLEAYRRLFPPAYAGSRERPDRLARYEGLSTWGQFLDHRGSIKADLRAAFLGNLAKLDPRCPSRVFPLPILLAGAPVECFYEFYAV